MIKPDERPTPRTWNDGWRCAECCNGDRCDDPTHHDRDKCPHCKGTGIAVWNMYTKEAEAKALITERDALREAAEALLNELGAAQYLGHRIDSFRIREAVKNLTAALTALGRQMK